MRNRENIINYVNEIKIKETYNKCIYKNKNENPNCHRSLCPSDNYENCAIWQWAMEKEMETENFQNKNLGGFS